MFNNFTFDLQRFATQTLSAGETYELDGVIFTAINDSQLNLDDGKISGLLSGKVTAVVSGAENSPVITFDATDKAIGFTATSNGKVITLKISALPVELSSGEFNYDGSTFTAKENSDVAIVVELESYTLRSDNHVENYAAYTFTDTSIILNTDHEISTYSVTVGEKTKSLTAETFGSVINNYAEKIFALAKDSYMIFNFAGYTLKTTALDEDGAKISIDDSGVNFVPNLNNGALEVLLTRGDKKIFEGELQCTNGSVTLGFDDTISLAKDTSFDIKIDDYDISVTATDKVGGKLLLNDDKIIFTPNENAASLAIKIKRDDTTIFENTIGISGGSVALDPTNNAISIADGTKFSLAFGDYKINIKVNGEATSAFELTDDGIKITPATGDGTLDVTLSNGSGGSMTANLEILSGSFTLGENGALTVAKDTELKIDFGDDYIVNFKTTSDAGGKISLSDDGINFTPNDGDGGLEISVTKGDDTRTTSLEMTGSVTYKLDGSITLAKGSVLKNVFADGNELTITANSDTSGSIIFNPSIGLIITPSTPDALQLTLVNEDLSIISISEITGTLTYNSGTITGSDGSEITCVTYDGDDQFLSKLSTKGGTSSVKFSADRTVYTANEGATFVMDYLDDGTTLEIQNGSFHDIFPTDTHDYIELITAGSNFKTNDDEFNFTLETAGSYTLNGIAVTTTEDNVEVGLSNYDTVTFDGISYTALDENLKLTIDDTTAKISGGTLQLGMRNEELGINFDLASSSIVYDGTTKTFTGAADTIIFLDEDGIFKAQAKKSFTFELTGDDDLNFTINDSEFDLINGTRTASMKLSGSMKVASNGAISLTDGTKINLDWDDGTELELNSSGSEGSISFDADKGIKITSDDENLSMKLTTGDFSTDISKLKGSIWYNAGTVLFDENSKLTATTTLGGQPIFTTLETVDGDAYISFNTSNGVLYSAGTGKLKVTWTSLDGLESTFIVNSGSVQLGHNLFRITEGSDIATDLKNFVPAFYFTTSEAGTYTINGQTIQTSAANLALTATDDYMTFKTSKDEVEYDGMIFTGNGNVSLKPEIVALGDGVKASGFGEDKTFMLAEAGNVTVDAKIFSASALKNKLDEEIPLNVSVIGNDDGFTFSREITRQSEDYFNKPNYSNVGKIFREEFHSDDDSYRIHTDPIGLQEIIGITAPASIDAVAKFDNAPDETIFDVVTDSEGAFTIGEHTYTISGDDNVAIMADFEADKNYVRGFRDLSGTVSGDFTEHAVSINGSSGIQILGDSDVSISANKKSYSIFGLDAGASVSVSAAGIYSVNSSSIAAEAGDVIVGNLNGGVHLFVENYLENNLSNTLVSGTSDDDYIENFGDNVTIDAGSGKNFVRLSGANEVIIFSGNTTVEGFNTGFGSGSDTLYIPGAPAAVDFLSGGLTFFDAENSITFSDINSTAKFNMFQGSKGSLEAAVFIADDDWYKVENSDLEIANEESLYFVGATNKFTHGVDFSGIAQDLNVTLDTDYDLTDNKIWINNVGSIKGGAGLTTITGSKLSDTIIASSGATTINAKDGDDFISLSGGSALINYSSGDGNDKIFGFNANSTLSISGGKYSSATSDNDLIFTVGDEKIILIGAANKNVNVIGRQDVSPAEVASAVNATDSVNVSGTVKLDDDGKTLAIVNNGGDNKIYLGDGGDAVAVYSDSGTVEIIGGTGADSLFVLDSAKVTFDMSAGGADKIRLITAPQNVTLTGYDAKNGGGILVNEPSKKIIVDEIAAGSDTRFGNGKVSLKTSDETQSIFTLAEKTNPTDAAIINFISANGKILPVGFTNSLGGTLDASDSSDDYLLVGNYFGDKNGGSSLFGGSGDDTLLGGAGDFLDAGTGNNLIKLAEDVDRDGATIILSQGRTTVENFTANDILSFDADIDANYQFDGTNVRIKTDSGTRATLEPIGNDSNLVEFFIAEEKIGVTKFAVVENGAIAKVKDLSARVYLGEKSGVDFSGVEENILVELSDLADTLNDSPLLFSGINYVAGGKENSTLIGSKASETLIAGAGSTTIRGGAGRDNFIGNTSADKHGSTTFFLEEGDQFNIVSDFEFLTAENFFTADKISTGDFDIKDAFVSGDNVIVKLYDDSVLQLNGAAGKDFQINDLVAKVDKNIVYDGLANCYVAQGYSSLTVSSSVESAEIWLDSSHGEIFIGKILTLDASAVAGNTSLVGNEFNNTILGGRGDSSLWGGTSGDDVLIGGASKNTFFYLEGNGRDKIQNAHDGDEIILDNITLEQISEARITDTGVAIDFTDGGSLTIAGTADVTYQLADGSKYSANYETHDWDSK